MAKMYKIRRKSDGLYSTGGNGYAGFSKRGKIWHSIGAVRNHIGNIAEIDKVRIKHPIKKHMTAGFDLSRLASTHCYHNCEVIEIEMIEKSQVDVVQFVENWNRERKF